VQRTKHRKVFVTRNLDLWPLSPK